MTLSAYAKTAQLITTDTPRWRDRLDAYALALEVSRADAIRQAVHVAVLAWERANGLTWVDPSQLGEGHDVDSSEPDVSG